MQIKIKRWTTLAVGAALASGAVTACGGEPADTAVELEAAASEAPSADIAPAALSGEGESGLGGEGEGGEGEGGVAIAEAATNPVVYRSAIAIAEAHVLAGRDALAAGETRAAAEMFAHPVSEVLADMAPIFATRGVEDVSPLFTETSTAVFDGEDDTEINGLIDGILAALAAAAEKAPDDGRSAAEIAAGVAADQIERATDMYRAATESDRYEPYLDGYGFFKAAQAAYSAEAAAIAATSGEASAAIMLSLDLLSEAYPTATRPETLDVDTAALTAAASQVILTARN